MRNSILVLVGLVVLVLASGLIADDKPATEPDDSAKTAVEPQGVKNTDQVVVYYLHMNRRCVTCGKLETYSKEAVENGFAEQLKDSSVVFKVENFEEEGNEHFAEQYQLYSQSLILSRQKDGQETDWKALDKIWTLVGDKDKFVDYVQSELTDFISPPAEK